jgi:3-hydroxy-9,10-secoandrosta-1,3,5(10)-triene-9,17-dione monooxygenase reductase component
VHNGRVISDEHPFRPDEGSRDPNRRFRGRLAAPVTIVTADGASAASGLTVSSLFVVEGEPGFVSLVVGPMNDLWDALAWSGRCVVHVASAADRGLADVFAGIRPSPGGMFAGLEVSDSDWGPVITSLRDRAYCRVRSMDETGWSGVVLAEIEKVEVADLVDPLLYFRGAYRRLG